jgi:hypothetical protein
VYPYAGLQSELVFPELLARPPAALEEVDPRLPSELHRMVRTAMARNKQDRYTRAGDFAGDLADFLKGIE